MAHFLIPEPEPSQRHSPGPSGGAIGRCNPATFREAPRALGGLFHGCSMAGLTQGI